MLCTLAQLKARLGIGDEDSDTLLTQIITGVSGQLQGEGGCGRTLSLESDIVEYKTIREPRAASIWLSRYPVVSISEIKEATYNDFDDADALTADDDFQFDPDSGEVHKTGWWLRGFRTAKITYTGGYVLPGDVAGDGETELPDDIVEAAIEQASFAYQRRDTLGVSAQSAQGGSVTAYAQDKLLPGVRTTMRRYRRML